MGRVGEPIGAGFAAVTGVACAGSATLAGGPIAGGPPVGPLAYRASFGDSAVALIWGATGMSTDRPAL